MFPCITERKAKGGNALTPSGYLTPQTSIDSEYAESTQEMTPEKGCGTLVWNNNSNQPLPFFL
jgi:hypothetical protein